MHKLPSLIIASFVLAFSFTPAVAETPVPGLQTPLNAGILPPGPPKPPEKCLRAPNGNCVRMDVAETARLRAFIIPQVRVSYFGTPAGTIGGAFIPFERFFQDDPVRFGLQTDTFFTGCCITRTR